MAGSFVTDEFDCRGGEIAALAGVLGVRQIDDEPPEIQKVPRPQVPTLLQFKHLPDGECQAKANRLVQEEGQMSLGHEIADLAYRLSSASSSIIASRHHVIR